MAMPRSFELCLTKAPTPAMRPAKDWRKHTPQTRLSWGCLPFSRNKQSQPQVPHENGYDTNEAVTAYPPPSNYPYYPSINSAPPPEMYYQPPPPAPQGPVENNGTRHNNLPPPEIASAIPCRYFPACRYGTACIFQHPTGPYFQGPLPPPAQYPSMYEQMPPQSYPPTYYPVSQPSFPPPPMNGQHPIPPPQGPPAPPSEMGPPPPQGHFSPNGAPAMPPYGPISPIVYTHPGQAPLPMSIPPLPPLHHQPPPPPAPQSPTVPFDPSSPPPAPQSSFGVQQNPVPYPPVNGNGSVAYPEINGAAFKSPQLNPQPELPAARETSGTSRRGTGRRGSFANRKPTPPCVFFPAGRCKNGNDCRFPHIMPQEGAPAAQAPPFYASRGGGPRRGGHANGNGFAAIDEKLAPEKSARGAPNGKVGPNAQANKRASVVKQRVPNADEFPVLAGTTTPPTRANGSLPNGNGHAGPTAAQILQAPRPARSNSSQAVTPRGVTPERVKETKPDVNGVEVHAPTAKLPVSFASIATAASDVSVAA
ncbi:Ankyrin repeat containing protein [Mycena sanguinolenta]|uniref:Ankyrin repeat containing protein n=1 Tax=Mycena sanguinolenta TaxID=230812 RepID=A0A8H7CIE4_9AGAR|nr:Ankyrin repeat containing protein [Mycena sanguinolenta]